MYPAFDPQGPPRSDPAIREFFRSFAQNHPGGGIK